MARQEISPAVAERRCPNCGTRVARDADSCFMCGHDLRIQKKRRQRVSWIDALLVLAVLAVLVVWWRIASNPRPQDEINGDVAAILPTNIPLMTPTVPVTATVAAEAAEPATPTPLPTPAASGVIRHRVREGETLYAIAAQYNVTVEEIQAANNMTDVLIRTGDELIIPVTRTVEEGSSAGTVQSRFEYTVQAGDTIVSIAARFGSTVEDILIINNLTNNDFIRPGDVLLIPVPEVPAEVLASTEPTPVPEGVTPPPPSTATGPVYAAPRLIGPPDEAGVALTEAALLRWISVDVLADNEWYVLLVYPISGAARSLPSIWTKATSYRLETDLAPDAGETATYGWQVSVVRVKPGVNNQYALEAASPPSELRSFTWR
jgi:LysM repeat protein/predicted nucleic acid-binding Zn ribbon protein